MRKYSVLIALLSMTLLPACGGYDPDDPEAPAYEEDYEYPVGEAYTNEQAGGGQPGEGTPWNECMNADCNMPEMVGDEIVVLPPPWEATHPNVGIEKTLPR